MATHSGTLTWKIPWMEEPGGLQSMGLVHEVAKSWTSLSLFFNFSLGLTGLISLLSKGFSRVFSSTTIQKHPFFSTQPSLWSNSYIHT